MSASTIVVIPARYGSSRFPGKPLALIAGRSMLSRTIDVAREAIERIADADFLVATEDRRIVDHCEELGAPCVLTSERATSGSDRVLEAARNAAPAADYIINLQGDAPFASVDAVVKTEALLRTDDCDVATPCAPLSWAALDALRQAKRITPFSGTTCIMNTNKVALWFSKNIIPAIRNEDSLRSKSDISPIFQHIGIYGFQRRALEAFCAAPPSDYEQLEGLEQLRMIDIGLTITCAIVSASALAAGGVDTPEDIERLEEMLRKHSSGAS